jgi:DNA polymerase-3 subunit delta
VTPDDFLGAIAQREPAPAYLFLGPEAYDRERCRRALVERLLPPPEREQGFVRHDLDEVEIAAVIDDARSFSLFAPTRLIWVSSCEAALPRGRAAAADDGEESAGKESSAGLVSDYLKSPSRGVFIVFDCSRYGFDSEDKAKLQRVQKYYSGVPAQVEFERYTPQRARRLARDLAAKQGLRAGSDELDLLVEVLGADAARIVSEIEKLSLYAGTDRPVTSEDIWSLVPNAKASTIFALVNAVGRNDRKASLESLDLLVRDGEYLPLALSFLATQFRLALVAKEARLTGTSQVQAHFSKQGTPMWRSRAEQVVQTAAAFSADRLRGAVVKIHQADKALRDARPDDRTVMEKFLLELTGS